MLEPAVSPRMALPSFNYSPPHFNPCYSYINISNRIQISYATLRTTYDVRSCDILNDILNDILFMTFLERKKSKKEKKRKKERKKEKKRKKARKKYRLDK